MAKIRAQTWIAGILVVVALPFVFFGGLWVYMTTTAKPLHPNPQAIPSVAYADPLPKWAAAVQQARQIVRARLVERNLPGLSVAVGIGSDASGNGEIVWAEGFGYADLKTSAPVTPNHRFPIGSASTVLTAAAAGLLLEDGRLKLDGEIQTYVPEFPKKQWPVTLREVMAHTAGVVPDEPDGSPLFTKHCTRPVEGLQFFVENALMFEPGTQYRFTNYDWILISAAIEAAAHQPFLTFMQEHVFDPLAMHDTIPETATYVEYTGFRLRNVFSRTKPATNSSPAPIPIQDRVTSYYPRFNAKPEYGPDPMGGLDYSCYAGSGIFLSTPSDLVRFGMAINSGKLLKPATVQMLQTQQRLASGKDTNYGLGWDVETVTLAGKPARMAGHNGDLGGLVASLVTFPRQPKQRIVVAVTSNISYADTFSLATKIAQAFADPGK